MINLRRSGALAVLVFLLIALACPPSFAQSEYGQQKVVYHFNSNNPQVFKGGLKNIQNHFNAVGQANLTVVALVHSMAWEMVSKEKALPELVEMMNKLIEQGTVFKMCNNTLNEFKLDPAKDLAIPMTVVPAGVAELARLQQQGYAYIKP